MAITFAYVFHITVNVFSRVSVTKYSRNWELLCSFLQFPVSHSGLCHVMEAVETSHLARGGVVFSGMSLKLEEE